mgnify:CR=1 FL=1
MKSTLSISSLSRQVLLRETRDYLMIALGMILYGIGWTVFLLPNDITTGGVPGIASIVFWATGFPVQYTYFLINAVLLMLALKILGFKFSIKTIFAVFTLTFFLSLIQELTAGMHLLQDQPFMACVLGASCCGSGIGIAFSSNGSTGGTDIIAAIINKYRDITLGRVMMICDMIIITSSYFVLKDWEKVVYGFVTLYVCSFVLDQIVNSARQSVQFFIISKKYQEIGKEINALHRGVTVIDATGLYTGQEQKMMFETRKILHDESLKITATTVRVPVYYGHSESVNVEFRKPVTLEEVKKVLCEAEGVIVMDDPENGVYPTALECADHDEVYVGRIRLDDSVDSGVNLWIVADNIRKGAATNAVQIAQRVIAMKEGK